MAKAKKLPSGNWRVRVYSHTDSQGKKHYESFTASTKQQAEMLGAKFANDIERRREHDINISEAVSAYIKANDGTLSPSTIKGYYKDAKYFQPIGMIRIRKVTTEDLQKFISSMSERGLSPKTISNVWGLLKSSLDFAGVDRRFKVHLPPVPKKKKYAPPSDDVIKLYNNANPKLKIAIMLAAFHGLRRGEIAALKYGDLSGNTLYVHSDIVKGVNGWVHKETPKTDASNRYIYLTDKEIELIGTGAADEYIVKLLPSSIGTNFYNLRNRLGIKGIRFHDLRAYYASIAVALGISDIYLARLGGWRENSQTLKTHYQKPIQDINEMYAQKMNDFFNGMT